jgi:hypothetical protein
LKGKTSASIARPDGPVAGGAEDRVGRVAFEVDSIVGDGVTDRVFSAVAIGLVEEVDFAVEHDRLRSGQALCLRATGLADNLAHFFPLVRSSLTATPACQPVPLERSAWGGREKYIQYRPSNLTTAGSLAQGRPRRELSENIISGLVTSAAWVP